MPFLALFFGGGAPASWPFVVLGVAVVFIILAIVVFRMHAFLALILAALLTGLLSAELPVDPDQSGTSHGVRAIELVAESFGKAAGGIGLVIAFASIIGVFLMESGAADKIVRKFVQFFGPTRGALAMLFSGFFLSIPVFFDTVFFLLIPLARALSLRAGGHYMLYVMAIGGGGALTHSIVPPTPGPLYLAGELNIDLGVTMIVGVLAGILPAVGAYFVAHWLDRRVPVPIRETSGASLEDLNAIISKRDDELPSFGLSVLPVVLPALMIAAFSFLDMARTRLPGVVDALGGEESFGAIHAWADFLGNKNFALLVGALISMWIFARQRGDEIREKLGPALESAGVIILITSAGGAFGAMIRHAGVGEAIAAASEGRALNLVLLAWIVTAVIRVAQGSATVAMVTAAGLMAAVIGDGSALPYHPVYIYLAIGFGSMILSWMNDSGFWVVGRLSGFSERETLRTWTVMVTALSLIGLAETLLFSAVLPMR